MSKPIDIRFWFSSEARHGVSWGAPCNDYDADVRFGERRVDVDLSFMTLALCINEQGREDDWLSRFMESNPAWNLRGTKLTLTSHGAKVVLRGFEDRSSCPISPSGGRIEFESGQASFCESAVDLLKFFGEGKKKLLADWKCDRREQPDGLDRVVCRRADERFIARDFDLETLPRSEP